MAQFPSYEVLSYLVLKSLMTGLATPKQQAVLLRTRVVGALTSLIPTAAIVVCMVVAVTLPPQPSFARVGLTIGRNVAFLVLMMGIALRARLATRQVEDLRRSVMVLSSPGPVAPGATTFPKHHQPNSPSTSSSLAQQRRQPPNNNNNSNNKRRDPGTAS